MQVYADRARRQPRARSDFRAGHSFHQPQDERFPIGLRQFAKGAQGRGSFGSGACAAVAMTRQNFGQFAFGALRSPAVIIVRPVAGDLREPRAKGRFRRRRRP